MDAEYSGYCGIGTRMASFSSLMAALRRYRTATEAPSVRKMLSALAGTPSLLSIKSATSWRMPMEPRESVYAPSAPLS